MGSPMETLARLTHTKSSNHMLVYNLLSCLETSLGQQIHTDSVFPQK